jgi:CGNR zinc finger/Putative stress-induced transcription regulator
VTGVPDSSLDLVVDFLNTVDVEVGSDALSDRASYQEFLRAHGLPVHGLPGDADLAAARGLRAALRAAVGGAVPVPPLTVPLAATLDPAGRPWLVASDPVGIVAAAAVQLAADGRWGRLKLCPADSCRWAFYDRSKNRSRHWCSMQECGNRAKSRAFRQRRAEQH